ncbi:lipopolysaccharide biosynthesis protein [Vibrio splendidus]|uniref:lipopolysaccharide biosynthesis protein n=1 Tax=Vibrio splendidus TaxID=29497 RepID=UPI000D360976|nr:lipopolysaccharide biosynthesis protein [Vibrio splendidus]PTP92704.1 flippase [Vibrio splendidus]
MSLYKKAMNGMLWNFFDKVINQVCSFIVIIYIARVIGPESFGLIGLLTIFLLLGESIVNSGFSQALIQKSKSVCDIDYHTIFIVNVIISFLVYILLYYSSPAISDFYSEPKLTDISRVLFLVIIINSFSVVCRAQLSINIDFKSIAIVNTISSLLGLLVAIIFVQLNYDYWSIVALNITKSAASSVLFFVYTKWRPRFIFSIDSFKSLFNFGVNLLISGLLAIFTNNLYSILIGKFYSTTQVGYFSQATNLTNTISTTITSVLQKVTYPILTSINDDKERLTEIYITLIKVTALISIPCMTGFAIIAEPFTHIFLGEEWVSIIPVLFYLSLARMFTPISAVNMNILNAIGRSDIFLKVDLIKIPIFLLGLYISLPYGINVIAIAMLATSVIAFFINAFYPGVFLGFGAIKQILHTYKIILSASIMYFVSLTFSFDSYLTELIFCLLVLPVVYFVSLLILREEILVNLLKKTKLGRFCNGS